jgi:hypothetical protein
MATTSVDPDKHNRAECAEKAPKCFYCVRLNRIDEAAAVPDDLVRCPIGGERLKYDEIEVHWYCRAHKQGPLTLHYRRAAPRRQRQVKSADTAIGEC